MGILEIKCPYCIRQDDPGTAPCFEGDMLKKNHMYYQVQSQLFACGAKYGDLQVCTFESDIPKYKSVRIFPEPTFFSECLHKSHHFFTICILPELVGKWYSRSIVIPSDSPTPNDDSSYNYCYCKEEHGGEMVGCDNPRCQAGEWFHLSCLRLKKKPLCIKWYCPHCQKLPEFSRKRSK